MLFVFIDSIQRLHAALAIVNRNLCDKPNGARAKGIKPSPSGPEETTYQLYQIRNPAPSKRAEKKIEIKMQGCW